MKERLLIGLEVEPSVDGTTVNAKSVVALKGSIHKENLMAEQSGISWTDATFNPWMGCTKVSPACKNCYAERDMDHRYGKVAWGPAGTRVVTSEAYWQKPIKWNKDAKLAGKRMRVFCASLADVFEDWNGEIRNHKGEKLYWFEGEWKGFSPNAIVALEPVTMNDVRARLFRLIDATPNLDWLLLTKRPENIERMWHCACCNDTGRHAFNVRYRPNVWLGTSVENQEYAEKRIPELLKCRDLVPVLFLSCEPMVGPITLFKSNRQAHEEAAGMGLESAFFAQSGIDAEGLRNPGIDWVICGGESGPNARPSHPDWFASLRDQCKAADVPFHFKQWGEWVPGDHDSVTFGDDHTEVLPWHSPEHGNDLTPMVRVGVNRAGRLLDGQLYDSFPVGV